MKTFVDFHLIKTEINKTLKSKFFLINRASIWIGQFQKRKHLTSGQIDGNGWRSRMGSWFVPYVQNTNKNFQDFWLLQMPL